MRVTCHRVRSHGDSRTGCHSRAKRWFTWPMSHWIPMFASSDGQVSLSLSLPCALYRPSHCPNNTRRARVSRNFHYKRKRSEMDRVWRHAFIAEWLPLSGSTRSVAREKGNAGRRSVCTNKGNAGCKAIYTYVVHRLRCTTLSSDSSVRLSKEREREIFGRVSL